jgi:hypothetical protein
MKLLEKIFEKIQDLRSLSSWKIDFIIQNSSNIAFFLITATRKNLNYSNRKLG